MKPFAAFASVLAAVFALAAPAAAQEAAAAAGAAPAAAEAPMPKGQEIFATCLACHGEDGNSQVPIYPSLAGQFPEYLLAQFMAFKKGVRQDESMQPFADMTSEEDAREALAWVSSQKPKAPEATVSAEDAAAGERIFRGGIMDRRIPSCAACHGPDGGGIAVQYPRIAGQHADYTVKQLTAFRDGTRTTNQTMADVAAKMNDKEIQAVANYIASLR